MSSGVIAHAGAARSEVNPPPPQLATYNEGTFKATYKVGAKECATAGFAFVSAAQPAAHAVAPASAVRPSSSTGVVHVESGRGTKFDNVGFVVHTSYNQAQEPMVRVYPYAIKPNEPGDFYHAGIQGCIRELVEQVRREGIVATVNGTPRRVAVREVSGESVVLDYFGDKPHALRGVSDQRATLADLSFTLRR